MNIPKIANRLLVCRRRYVDICVYFFFFFSKIAYSVRATVKVEPVEKEFANGLFVYMEGSAHLISILIFYQLILFFYSCTSACGRHLRRENCQYM